MLMTKQELINNQYDEMLDILKNYEPLEERDFFPYVTDGVEVLDYELPIALLNNLKIKNKRQMIEKHNVNTNIDIQDVYNSIWKELLKSHRTIYDVDNTAINVINNVCKEKYNFYFTDENILTIKCNDVHHATYEIDDMCLLIARKVLNNKDKYEDVVIFY